ncbi:MAG TPA: tetratricopeptide repeat protein [Pyrinomonadaceae bacterium]|nr:tetratricopeptide repeat protein [Pyrinomonadaceae bacterium]
MRKDKFYLSGIISVLFVSFAGGACVQQTSSLAGLPPTEKVKSAANAIAASPADAKIEAANKLIQKKPDDANGYNRLALAYLAKVRETGDHSLNRNAEAALKKSFEIDPQNYDAMILDMQRLNSEHLFEKGLERAKQAAKLRPTDSTPYAGLTDALIELGRYPQAVETAQKMVDMRPNAPAYARIAHLRYLHGEIAGAFEAKKLALQMADPGDSENLAWYQTEFGNLLFNTGNYDEAENAYNVALKTFPDYHLALVGKGHSLAAKGDFENAVKFYTAAQTRVPTPETIIALGNVYTKLGNREKAQEQYDLVEFVEQKLGSNSDQGRLALFWADHDIKLDEALAIAQREHSLRKDIYTADTLAWCLYKKGNFAEAKKAINEALRLKTKDAQIFYHAGMIEKGLGNKKGAADYLQKALKTNPAFDLLQSEAAKSALREVQ